MTTPEHLWRNLTATHDLDPSAPWGDAFRSAPRGSFVPDLAWSIGPGRRHDPIEILRTRNRGSWERQVYGDDTTIVSAFNRGRPIGVCPMPSALYAALLALDVGSYPIREVTVVGASTGWAVGILAAAIPAATITGIEKDPAAAAIARANLHLIDFRNWQVSVGDGARLGSDLAPSDRILSTCRVNHIPPSWLSRANPHAVIVTPWGGAFDDGAMLHLHVGPDRRAEGTFTDEPVYPRLNRRQPDWRRLPAGFNEHAPSRTAALPVDDATTRAGFALGLLMPDCTVVRRRDDAGILLRLWILAPGSAARWSADTNQASQLGPRRLWDELEEAYRQWTHWGHPSPSRFGLTVSDHTEAVWLDDPRRLVRPVAYALSAP